MPFKRGDKGAIRLHLNDECPRIGCGIRRVNYAVGNRTVTLTNPYTGRKAKIDRSLFEKLAGPAAITGEMTLNPKGKE